MNILITGASRGIGRETAKEFAMQAGNRVVAVSRSTGALQELQSETKDFAGTLIPYPFDLTEGNYDDLLRFVSGNFDTVDVLINNAGTLINKPFEKLTIEDFNLMFRVNAGSPFRLVQALLPYMQKGSHIVNIGSMGGVQGSAKFPGLSLYSASKGALAILTECLAVELEERGISVNCLAIGAVQTEMLSEAFPGYEAPVSPEEMGYFIREFASNGNRFFNGKILPVAMSNP